MIGRICTVPRCTSPAASQFSNHCTRHKSALRRHGAPEQRGITKTELAPYIARIEARMARNPDSELWPLMEPQWRSMITEAEALIIRRTGNRYDRSAAHEIVGIATYCTPMMVIKTVLAVVLFWQDRPQRFTSDNALRVQIARRVRALSQCHVGLRYDYQMDQQVRVYREITPKAATILGRKLMTTFGSIGLHLAALDERDRKAAQDGKDRLTAAINNLI